MAYKVPGYKYLYTERPQGKDLNAGQIDLADVQPRLLALLDTVGRMLNKPISIFSGYRTSAYSQAVGGFAGDPHSRSIAVDANIGTTPIGAYPGVLQAFRTLGLISGNQPNFYHGQPDPAHVQLGSGQPPIAPGKSGVPAAPPTTTGPQGNIWDTIKGAVPKPLYDAAGGAVIGFELGGVPFVGAGAAGAYLSGGAVDFAKNVVGGGKSVIDTALAVPEFLAKLADPNNWLRALQIVGGAALAFAGLLLLARQVGLAPPSAPAPVQALAGAVE